MPIHPKKLLFNHQKSFGHGIAKSYFKCQNLGLKVHRWSNQAIWDIIREAHNLELANSVGHGPKLYGILQIDTSIGKCWALIVEHINGSIPEWSDSICDIKGKQLNKNLESIGLHVEDPHIQNWIMTENGVVFIDFGPEGTYRKDLTNKV